MFTGNTDVESAATAGLCVGDPAYQRDDRGGCRFGVQGAAGITAGSWYASPATHVGHELIAAGCSSFPVAAVASHWTMSSLSAGRVWGTSAGREHGTETLKDTR